MGTEERLKDHKCIHEGVLGGIKQAVEDIRNDILEDRSHRDLREERMVKALEEIASEKAYRETHGKAIQVLFDRMRDHDIQDGQNEKKKPLVIRMWEHARVGPALMFIILLGALLDGIGHRETLEIIVKVIKQLCFL